MPENTTSQGTDNSERELQQEKDALEELRRLLVGPEKRELVVIRERIENPTLRAQDVSGVLVEAVRLQRESAATEFDRALTPSVEVGLKESVRKDPSTLADALYPVMGPAIRKSIADYINLLVHDFNRAIEESLSLRSLKWRIEAFRTGRSFAEIVLVHSLVYRVEQLFLIHRESALVLQHVALTGTDAQDPAMVSAMLGAIQDYARDSFQMERSESLESLQVGEIQIWVEQGPQAILAAAVRGHAPQTLRTCLVEKLEKFHQVYGSALDDFHGETAAFDGFAEELAACMTAEHKEKHRSRPKPYFLICLGIVAAILLGWSLLRTSQARRWEGFVTRLRAEPGIVVVSFEREGRRFHLQGLRDPLATNPTLLLRQAGLDPTDADLEWRSYQALDEAIVLRRVQVSLQSPSGVSLSFRNSTLYLTGEAPRMWIETAAERAPLIAGVEAVDTKGMITSEQAELARLQQGVESSIVFFPFGSADIPKEQRSQLENISQRIAGLLAQAKQVGEPLVIELVGRADSVGQERENRLLSQERANRVLWELRRRIKGSSFRAKGIGSSEPLQDESDEAGRQRNRSVTFHVILLDSAER
jgi:outer membrane protein OmpA-like peptidoglycan-associated protein